MRLRDDLNVLAQAAPLPPDPDVLLRRARTVRIRRTIMVVPAVAVVAALVVVVAHLWRLDGPSGTVVAFAFQVQGAPDQAALQRARQVVEQRARFLGFRDPQARVEGDRIVLEFGGESVSQGDGVDLKRLAVPGNLQVRKVIEWLDVPVDASPTPTLSAAPEARPSTLEQLIAKLTPVVYFRALGLTGEGDPKLLPGFETLTPQEVTLLPPSIRLYVPTISCNQLVPATPAAGEPAVACLGDSLKMLMDRSALGGADLDDATTFRDTKTRMYQVKLHLKDDARQKWGTVSAEAADGVECRSYDTEHCLLAFMVDGEVLSAPSILRRLTPDEATMSGQTAAEARLVASILGPRELPPGVKLVA